MLVSGDIRYGINGRIQYMGYNEDAMNDTSTPLGPPLKEDEADYRVAVGRTRERALPLDEFLEDNDYELDAQGRPVRKQRVQESTRIHSR